MPKEGTDHCYQKKGKREILKYIFNIVPVLSMYVPM